jgi:hypothetical protein
MPRGVLPMAVKRVIKGVHAFVRREKALPTACYCFHEELGFRFVSDSYNTVEQSAVTESKEDVSAASVVAIGSLSILRAEESSVGKEGE